MKPLRLHIDVPRTPEFLEIPAESLTALNYQLMRVAADNGVDFPPLYDSGIVYRREPPGREWWESALELVALGEGDCEDLAAYRAAELRYREGDPARVRIYRTRRRTFHAIVERGDGTFEDPSRVLAQLEYERAGTFPYVK